MLNSQCPKRVVQPIVEVCDGDLHPPIVLVVDLHMPVDSNRAHVVGALQQRGVALLRSVYSHRFKNFRVRSEKQYYFHHGSNTLLQILKLEMFGIGNLLDTISLVLATTSTMRTRSDCIIIEG